MADFAIQFLMENLQQLLIYNAELIKDVKDNVQSLYNELDTLKAFLKDSSEKQIDNEMVKQLVRQIRDVVYDAEDAIDAFVIQASVQKARKGLKKLFNFDYPIKIRKVAKQIKKMRAQVKQIYDDKMFGFDALQAGDASNRGKPPVKRAPVVEEDNVVGFENEIKMFVKRLTAEQEELDIISVIGMGGLGKTTLARKVYTHPDIEYEFCNRAWVYVSEEYNPRNVFLSILGSITQFTDSMFTMNDERLAEELRKKLEAAKYLIVLDDVWTTSAWDRLKIAFPNNNKKSRVMVTSRSREVAVHANPDSVHHLRFLTHDESWELLRKKVFRKESCPSELVKLGKEIAEECKGLPLAIVVIAGLLVKRDKTSGWWTKVAQSVKEYIARDPEKCREVLALSYKHLPYHLKACFLYLGIFPEDFEIPVWKLILLWVAEGFIPLTENVNLEDIAEEYLEDLVDRNLVLVEKKRSNGRIKTCRVHDMLRELCLKEADEENFFKEIIKGGLVPNSSLSLLNASKNNQRRLCIHSNVPHYISSKPSAPQVRSLLCFSSQETKLPLAQTSFIPDAFKLIRVLDIKPIKFPCFPSEIIQLIHLRYIALSGDFNVLPASISNLWNTQTLIVNTRSRTLDIKADIWKMLHLRHLYTSASSQIQGHTPKNEESSAGLIKRNIQTMSSISPQSCTENVLGRTPNLKKLGIRGKLLTLVDVKEGSSLFGNLAKLESVETLKLLNDTYPDPPSETKLPRLPRSNQFPSNLKKLTLSETFVDWKHMGILGMLKKLEVLKLNDHAFMGWLWEPLDGGFQLLKFLHIGRTDLVQWNASSLHFPTLQRLVIRHCEKLREIPYSLGNISTLQTMELYWPTPNISQSARRIKEQRQKMQQEHSLVNIGFKLTVFPPEQ